MIEWKTGRLPPLTQMKTDDAYISRYLNGEVQKVEIDGNLLRAVNVWRFVLRKLICQSVNQTLPEFITIDLDEMAEETMFIDRDAAYKGIETMIKKMGLLHINRDYFEEKKCWKMSDGGILLYCIERENGSRFAEIYVNRRFGFEFFRRIFCLTEYVYSLIDAWLYGYLDISENGGFIETHLNGITQTQFSYDVRFKEELIEKAEKRRTLSNVKIINSIGG